MTQPGRNSNISDYRFGYNGMELDNEAKGNGNSYTTEFRQYDPRLGRWLSLDPLAGKYPNISPYVAFNDNPILLTDPLGLEPGDGDKKSRRENRAESRAAKLTPDEKAELEHQKAPNKIDEVVIKPAKKGFVTIPAAAVEVQTMTKTVTAAPKPAPAILRWSILTLPATILTGDTRKTTLLYDTDKLQVTQTGSSYYVVPKPGVKVSPKEKEVLEDAQKLLDRGSGGETDVYVLTAKVTGKHYECKSCITCKGSDVELKVGQIAKFGISQNTDTRYTPKEKAYLDQTTILDDVPRDVARAFEKIFIVNYTLGGYENQRGELESRGIYTTFGKPIQNPIFR